MPDNGGADTKVCRACQRTLPLNAFARDARYHEGRRRICRDCRAAGRVPPKPEKKKPKPAKAKKTARAEPPPLSVPARLPASIFKGKPVQTERQALRWVLDHLAVEDVRPEDCPSAKAWFFYIRALQDQDFADQLALKFVPNRTELSEQQGFGDDDRDVRDRLARIRDRARRVESATAETVPMA